MQSFFDKPFEEQVEEIIKTGDLKLLQALIGTRSLIGLSLYCSSFFLLERLLHKQSIKHIMLCLTC
ncbi:hypothetical protein [Wolbachia endosymbiont (group B) of Erynnis tages]|uniref:hypothetical protein n=1 Tax=Wolbachia endosymbiont (group B) of Erynnis tages TaxID=2954011 RepID=UPI0022264FC9|nr:hypothetical protein [Wolbachia endosymbiont (group B) of Erynnis tages]